MCASCRILHDPIWFRYLLLVGNIHQFWVAVLVQESMYARLWQLDLIEILYRFPYVHTDSCIVSMVLHSVRWWIFRVGIPHTTWDVYVNPYMRTISLCKWGLSICKMSGLSPCTHTESPRMRTGISLWDVSNLSTSHALKQNFVHTRTHSHIKNHCRIALFWLFW